MVKTENFQVFFIFIQFLVIFLAISLQKTVLKTQQGLILVSPVGNFDKITAFLMELASKTPRNP